MTNLELAAELLKYDEIEVRVDATFNAQGPSPARVVMESKGILIVRDYYMLQNGDICVKLPNGNEYEVVR